MAGYLEIDVPAEVMHQGWGQHGCFVDFGKLKRENVKQVRIFTHLEVLHGLHGGKNVKHMMWRDENGLVFRSCQVCGGKHLAVETMCCGVDDPSSHQLSTAVIKKLNTATFDLADGSILSNADMGTIDHQAISVIGNVGRHGAYYLFGTKIS